jgi:hypothetical protein
MAETAKSTAPLRSAERAQEALSAQQTNFLQANSVFIEAFARASETFLRRVAAFNEQMLGFAQERLQKNSEAGEALTKAKDISDAIHVHQDWARLATQQYAEQVGRVIELTTRTALASFEPLSNLAERSGEAATNLAERGAEEARRSAEAANRAVQRAS